jgi:hypothetical protein
MIIASITQFVLTLLLAVGVLAATAIVFAILSRR